MFGFVAVFELFLAQTSNITTILRQANMFADAKAKLIAASQAYAAWQVHLLLWFRLHVFRFSENAKMNRAAREVAPSQDKRRFARGTPHVFSFSNMMLYVEQDPYDNYVLFGVVIVGERFIVGDL